MYTHICIYIFTTPSYICIIIVLEINVIVNEIFKKIHTVKDIICITSNFVQYFICTKLGVYFITNMYHTNNSLIIMYKMWYI